ncbi:MAG: hypothetical protein V1745_01595 [Patescibacteria group bacterium]
MALRGRIESEKKGEESKELFLAEFTNGTLQQLRDLAIYLEKEGFPFPVDEAGKMTQVIKIGIGWLEAVKKRKVEDGTQSQ